MRKSIRNVSGKIWGARNAKKVHEAVRGGSVNSFGRKNRLHTTRRKRQKNGVLRPEDCVKSHDPRMIAQQEATVSFTQLGINRTLIASAESVGIVTPTAIQAAAIPPILHGRDVIALSQTGTGKTAAYLLPLMTRSMRSSRPRPFVVIVPTRELAAQVAEMFTALAGDTPLRCVTVVGGGNVDRQLRDLQTMPQCIIATPGRLHDMVERDAYDFSAIRTVVIDEIDRLADAGFLHEVRFLLSQVAARRQVVTFSATLKKDMRSRVRTLLHNPVTVAITPRPTAATVDQSLVYVHSQEEMHEKLHDVLIDPAVTRALVFVNTKRDAAQLYAELKARGFAVAALHGDMTRAARLRAIQKLRNREVTAVVATDVAARGVDIPDVSHVINAMPPLLYDDYVHRIGRTGRAGRRGTAITFWLRR